MNLRFGKRHYLTMQSYLGNLIFEVVKAIILVFLVLVTLYPFWNTVIISFNQAVDTIRGGLYFWPRVFTLANYKAVWITANIPQALFVSVARATCSTFFNLFLTTMLAYALSRKEFVLRKPLTIIVVLSMYVNAGIFPNYFLINKSSNYGKTKLAKVCSEWHFTTINPPVPSVSTCWFLDIRRRNAYRRMCH